MNSVTITKGPKNWQIIQRENGYGKVCLTGRIIFDKAVDFRLLRVVIHVYDENNRNDVISPIYISPKGEDWGAAFEIPVGGMYTIATFLRYGEREIFRGDAIFHIGVGDVYLIAGQSNAFGTSKDSVEDTLSPYVHVFRLNGTWDMATHPLHDSTGAIFSELYDEAAFHSPWIAFARMVYEKTGCPIGLIPAAKGGTPLSYWDTEEDGRLMKAAIEMVRLSGGKVKGILWYQGCNDTMELETANTYLQRFQKVCTDFIRKLGKKLVFLTVQLNKSTYNISQEKSQGYAIIREAQRQASKMLRNVYVVPSMDLPVCDTIHNNAHSNLVIAKRLANIALKYIYKQAIVCDFPDIQKAERIACDRVRLSFSNVIDSLTADYVEVETYPFQVIDEKGKIDLRQIRYNTNHTLDLTFERAIGEHSYIGCTKMSYLGTLPYDIATRLPILAFNNVEIEDGYDKNFGDRE